MSALANALPYDIWERVSLYIPQNRLQNLYPVNRDLFYLSMNTRYKEVSFDAFDDRKMRLLNHLRNQRIAGFVRTLRIDTLAVFTSHCARGQTIFTSEQIIHAMTAAIPHMTKVQTLKIHWRNTPFSHDLVPFFAALWVALGTGIQRLYISAPLSRLQTILRASTARSLPALEELTILVREDNSIFSSRAVQQDTLAPFINHVRLTLRSLTIRSMTSTLDLSPLFEVLALTKMPKLASLDLEVSPTNCGISPGIGEGGFSTFLRTHADDLEFFSWSALSASSPSHHATDTSLLTNIYDHFDTHFTALSSIRHLGLSIPQARSLQPLLKSLPSNLSHLDLNGIDLSFDDLSAIVTMLSSFPIQSLHVWLAEMSSRVISVLGSLPPTLDALHLHTNFYGFQMFVNEFESPTPPVKNSFRHYLRKLEVRGNHLLLHEFQSLVTQFGHTFPSFMNNLELLILDIYSLEPQLIDYLSNFTRLQDLWLCIVEVTSEWADEIDDYTGSSELFRQGMEHRYYPSWTSLHTIRLTSKYWDQPNELHQVNDHPDLVEVLARCIPSLQ